MKVEDETAYCIDINTDFKNGYKTRTDASTRMSADQISDVALSLEYVKQYGEAHKELNYKQVYLLEQCVVWQRLSVHLGLSLIHICNGRSNSDRCTDRCSDSRFYGKVLSEEVISSVKGRILCLTPNLMHYTISLS